MAIHGQRFTRRRFIGTGLASTAWAAFPGTVFARTSGTRQLVVIILRGAMDGLGAVPPVGDPDYARVRGELALAPSRDTDGAFALDDTFDLHPSLDFFRQRYRARELIVFHAVASPYRDRSHFDGQAVLESGLPLPSGSTDGWLNRVLATLPSAPLGLRSERGVALSQNIPLILRGSAQVLTRSPTGPPNLEADLLERLVDLYSQDDHLSARLAMAMQAQALTGGDSATSMQFASQDRLEAAARMAAAVMTSEDGPQIAVLESTGWDTHANQGCTTGALAQRLAGLDRAMRALGDGLGSSWRHTAVLIVTEFGRTVAVNGTHGTDHGTGSCAFLAGGAVQGGRVITDWPGLAQKKLLDNRDLRATLDLRSIFKGVLAEHLRIDARTLADRVFPDSRDRKPLTDLIRV